MYADRNQRTRMNPVSLTAAIAINGGLIGALLFSAPELIPIDEIPPIIARHIPLDPPPPPDPVKPVERVTQPKVASQPSRIDTPETIVEVAPATDFTVLGPPIPPQPPVDVSGPGSGGGVTVDPPAPLPPAFVDAARDPRYASDFQPEYPTAERRAGNEGRVTVKILIGPDGRVKAVERVAAASTAFFEATRRQALARWRFKPATRGGVPVESWQTLTVRFVLQDA